MNVVLFEKSPWKMLSIFTAKWYFHVARETLIKYKVVSIVLVSLFTPLAILMLKTVAHPVNVFLYPNNVDIKSFLICIVGVQLFSIIFGLIHESVFTNRAWDGFVNSLPISHQQRMVSDVITLTLANSVFLISLFYICFSHPMTFHWEAFIRLVFLVLTMYSIQVTTIYKNNLCLIQSIVLGLMIIPVIMIASMPIEAIAIGMVSYLLYRVINSAYLIPGKFNGAASLDDIVDLGKQTQLRTLMLLNMKIILSEYRLYIARILPSVVLSMLFLAFLRGGSFPLGMDVSLLAAMLLLNMFFLSQIFNPIVHQWKEYKNYLLSLPLPHVKLLTSIFLLGLIFGLATNAVLLSVFCLISKDSAILQLCALILISLAYLFYCFIVQIKFKRYGVLASFIGLILFYHVMKFLMSC